MFRRRRPAADSPPTPVTKRDGKGRATPKRSQAEAVRRQRVRPPRDRREAARRARAKMREERLAARQALLRGDERRLPPRDAGPVRRLARDVVDSRRTIGEFFLPIAFVVFLLGFVRNPLLNLASTLLFLMLTFTIAIESVIVARLVKKAVRERFPDADTRGLTSYAVMRSIQFRRFRLPPPMVKPGERP